ncbi:multiple ankyrin repeats single kh domain-containing protein [Fusarium pseudoanthophilum]|uniref:Multiple ankyrin repeats single kh domain-containing protein n=1 Tax=Fusarium pseudoanthophilum TaxID=48495 RepID=A0A8H5Q2P3_9HYPO|nr:multiple ankyrin repeats single kh domain-containing protein [Fusarium pseudoanthophilum]
MSRAPKISEAIWERHKSIIRTLYIDEDNGPEKVSEVLRDKYGFTASRHQIIRRLARWKFKKYTTKEEWVYTSSQIQRRKEQDRKMTEIVLNGKRISEKKLSKALGRYVGPWDFGPECQRILPCEDLTTIEIQTPKEDVGIMPYSTPWFKFWTLAEETALPRFHEDQRHPVLEDCGSLLLQWIFYAGSNRLVSVEYMQILLKWAIDNNYLQLIKDAIALGGLTVQTASRYLLPSAVEVGDLDLLKLLLHTARGPGFSSRYLDRAFAVAINNVDGPMVDLLLENGANATISISTEELPIRQALKLNNSDRIVRSLLESGADIRRMSISHSILLYARTTASAKLLLEAGAPVNFAGRMWFTPLQQAAIRNDLDMVTLLLGAGADPNLVCDDARDLLLPKSCVVGNGHMLDGISLALISPLMFARGHENFDMARCLVDAGATADGPMANHHKGENPRLCPISQWNIVYLYMLRWWGVARSIKDVLPQFPGAVDCVKICEILEALSQPAVNIHSFARDWHLDGTALQAAIEINDCVLVDALTEDWVDVDETPCSYPILPVLQTASLNGDNSLLRLLVRRGGDIHAQPAARGLTCLQAAAMSGSQELVEQLLQMGARVDDYQSGNDTTALQAAVISGSIGTVRAVLHAGADVNDSQGVCSALYHAAYGQDPEMCDFLLRKGALVDQGNRNSPLIAAIFRGSHEMANLLLEAGGNPNRCTRLLHHKWSESSMPHLHYEEEDENDVQLWTPLAAACYWSDIAMIELLLQYGAKLHKGTKCQFSPVEASVCRNDFSYDLFQFILHLRVRNLGGLSWDDRESLVSRAVPTNVPYEVVQQMVALDLLTEVSRGKTLVLAAKKGLLERVRMLVRAGTDIHSDTANIGGAALKVACQEGHLDVAEYLLAEGIGCRLWYESQNHAAQLEDALKAAEANGHFNLVALLLKHMAATNIEKSNTFERRHGRALVAGRVDIAYLYREHDLSRYNPNNRPVLAGVSECELAAGTNRGRLDTLL